MTWDLAAGKARLGIAAGDTTKDAFVTAALNASLALAESYCDRKFLYAAERATFNHPRGASLSLPRYPLEQITAVTGDTTGAAIKYHMESGTGLVILDGWAGAYLNRQGYYSAVLETAKAKMEPYEWAYWMEGKPAERDIKAPDGSVLEKAGKVRDLAYHTSKF